MLPKIIFIVGPTAAGKSDAALQLAKKEGGEIVSCDSTQVYRELNIVTSKPSPRDLGDVPHHLVNRISVTEEFNVAQFRSLAAAAIETILQRNRIPIVVGGSGLYMQILLDGIFSSVPDDALRRSLERQAQEQGNQPLYDALKTRDPAAAGKIHPNDLRRIIRALEVVMSSGQPISDLQRNREGLWGKYEIEIFGLNMDRPALYAKIERRVDQMLENGAVEEIRACAGLRWSKTAQGIIGVKEILGYLQGRHDLDRARSLMKQNTRHLAKRQLTWFRKEKRIRWLEIGDSAPGKEIRFE